MKNHVFPFLFLSAVFFCSPVRSQEKMKLNVFFAHGESLPVVGDNPDLSRFLNRLDSLNIIQVSILAYCSDPGSSAFNESLSFERAKAVKELLLERKISEKSISTFAGKGELALKKGIKEDVEKQRAFNRRVELTVSYQVKPIPKKEPEAVVQEEQKPVPQKIITEDSKEGDLITLDNILFEGGRHFLLAESYPSLDNLLNTLKSEKKYHIMILGHVCCNPIGMDGMDNDTGIENLSVARAQVIYDFLVRNGIDPKRLDYKGMKSDFKTGLGDKYDRRVEVQITKIDK